MLSKLPALKNNKQYGFNALLLLILVGIVLIGLGIFWYATHKNQTASVTQKPIQPKKIGIIQAVGPVLYDIPNGFKDEMKKKGYVEGKDITYLYDDWNEDPSKIDGIVKKMLDQKVDLLYIVAEPAIYSAFKQMKERNVSIPIVYTLVEEPVKSGISKSFEAPGNNATGIVSNTPLAVSKQLEFLKKIKPDAKKLGFFGEGFHVPQGPGDYTVNTLKEEAPKFGLTLVEYKTTTKPGPDQEADFQKIADSIKPGDIDALMHIPSHFIPDLQKREAALAKKLKIITIEPILPEVLDGGLYSYNVDLYEMGKQSAPMVDKVLKGTDAGTIPVEYPNKNILVVNMKTAKDIGLTIPDEVLQLADKQIQ